MLAGAVGHSLRRAFGWSKRELSGKPGRRGKEPCRLGLESMEERLMLDSGLPGAIVVGRTLSAYAAASVQNNQLDITYTVYNEQSTPINGVLLTDTLRPGVTYKNSTQAPDRNGQELAWSLGTIEGFDRASVTLTVSLSDLAQPIDLGAHAYGTLNAGMVSDAAPAGALRQGNVDPLLLASTVDANTTDPFIQEKAASLDYDPQRVFDFLHNEIGFESYAGSVRGARGTLWSQAGNALDVASLGVGLMRASGIPAQYAVGTLSPARAKQLIVSMFPEHVRTVGSLPGDGIVADPVNDSELLAEVQSHAWFQFDSGTGMVQADPLMTDLALGQAATAATGTFSEIADTLRHKTQLKIVAEITHVGDSLFGLEAQQELTVIDKTFNDVELVGRPLTIGFNTTSVTGGSIFTTITHTYSPFLAWGDDASDLTHDQIIRGDSFQDVLTNFPLGSQVVSGVFLNITQRGPQLPIRNFQRALCDRIGYAARQGFADAVVSISADAPAFSNYDSFTLDMSAAAPVPHATAARNRQLQANTDKLVTLQDSDADATVAAPFVRAVNIDTTRLLGNNFLAQSELHTRVLATTGSVAAYYDRPRVVLVSAKLTPGEGANPSSLRSSIDIVNDSLRVEAGPGQSIAAPYFFNLTRGIFENIIERDSVVGLAVGGTASGIENTFDVFTAAHDQGIGFTELTVSRMDVLDQLAIGADAKARIATELADGYGVIVPNQPVLLNGRASIAWAAINLLTGEYIGVTSDGGHQGQFEYIALVGSQFELAINTIKFFSPLAGVNTGTLIGVAFRIGDELGGDRAAAIQELQKLKDDAVEKYEDLLEKGELLTTLLGFAEEGTTDVAKVVNNLVSGAIGEFRKTLPVAQTAFEEALNGTIHALTGQDPALIPVLSDPQPQITVAGNRANNHVPVSSTLASGAVAGSLQSSSLSLSGQISAAWSSNASNSFLVNTLSLSNAGVTSSSGQALGTGSVSLASDHDASVSISGNNQYQVDGSGSLSFYGDSVPGLAVSGSWESYTASVTGNIVITIDTDGLKLGNQLLPPGSYTITANAASLGGLGQSASPSYSGAATVTATTGVAIIGPSSGSLSLGGQPLDATSGVTMTGFTGSIAVTPLGTNLNAIALNGSATAALTVASNPTGPITDQNTPVAVSAIVKTTSRGTYDISAEAPIGWVVSLNDLGALTISTPTGTQGGSYPIRLVVRSSSNDDLVAQTTVMVSVTATSPGIDLAVVPDPMFTVPYSGAQIPSAFRATIRNLGPAADTFQLSFTHVTAGFEILNSRSAVSLAAGETGIVGVYLSPDGTQAVPLPGTNLSFDVTATSAVTPAINETVAVNLTMPAAHGLSFNSKVAGTATTPGAPVNATLTLKAVGNVPETVNLSSVLSAGLSMVGLPASLALQPNQSMSVPITLTPAASTPLNSTLNVTITAKFDPHGDAYNQAVSIPIRVLVPGADDIATASYSAQRLGNADLASRLDTFATALTNLVQHPGDEVFKSQALAALDALIPLLAAEQYLGSIVPALNADRVQLADANSAEELGPVADVLATDMTTLNNLLTQVIGHRFNLYIDPHTQIALPNTPARYNVGITNQGTEATTYDLTTLSLPGNSGNVGASLNKTSITLQPGETSFGGPNGIVLSLTSNNASLVPAAFQVTATAHGFTTIAQKTTAVLNIRQATLNVVSVTADPPFTNPGGQVNVSTVLLNAVNSPQPVLVSFTAKNPGGTTVYSSTPVAVTLAVDSTIIPVAIGPLNTSGFTVGDYTLDVTVTSPSGVPLAGGTGRGHLLIGTPVSGSVTTSPVTTSPGVSFVTNTLTLHSESTFPSPLTSVGHADTAHAAVMPALLGTLAYVTTSDDLQIVDVSVPTNPVVVKSFGTDDVIPGGYTYARIINGQLVVGSHIKVNSPDQQLLIYDLTDPLNPVLLSNTSIPYPYSFDLARQGDTIYLPLTAIAYTNFGGDIVAQYGDVVAVDLSDPAAPQVSDVLFNDLGAPLGSTHNVDAVVAVTGQLAYVATTTSTGGATGSGTGQIAVINTANPANLSVANTLNIPGIVHAVGIGISGNRALVVGTTGGWNNPNSADVYGYSGNIELAVLDISDPASPVLLSTLVTANKPGNGLDYSHIDVLNLGNGLFAVGDTTLDDKAVIQLVSISDPDAMLVGSVAAPSIVTGMEVSGNHLIATSSAGVTVYEIGTLTGLPVTASVRVPKGTGTSGAFTLTNSFSEPPTQTIVGATFDTLIWKRSFGLGTNDAIFTWESRVEGVSPDTTRQVTLGTTINFISAGTPGSLELPQTTVAAQRVITLTPPAQAVSPSGTAEFTVELSNPSNSSATYQLTVRGVPASWVNITPSVVVPAHSTEEVPLELTPDAFARAADYAFTITTTAPNSTLGSAEGTLTVEGRTVQPDPQAHAVVVQVLPLEGFAGIGTEAVHYEPASTPGDPDVAVPYYRVRLTNTGSQTETFDLSIVNLPDTVTAVLSQRTVVVPPGASNFRDVKLELTPQDGTPTGSISFFVMATATQSGATDEGAGILYVLENGVDVTIDPTTAVPGNELHMTVRNTGSMSDTFDLAVAGPSALVATLSAKTVTLEPGASQIIPITTSAAGFAVPGKLNLVVTATSQTDPAVRNSAAADLNVASLQGLNVAFEPAATVLPVPGTTSFLLLVHNTGNVEDAYSATVIGANGPITGRLMGLDGQPVQTIPEFRLPGLSSGAILLVTDLETFGQGNVTVEVRSLNDAARHSTAVASASAAIMGNPGTFEFHVLGITVGEHAGTATIEVSRVGGSDGTATVDVSTAPGAAQAATDYTAKTQKVSFAAGQTAAIFSVPIVDDAVVEADESFRVTLSSPSAGATINPQRASVEVTILDDDVAACTTIVLGARFAAVGDFNRDGQADLAIARRTANAIDIVLGQANGQLGTARRFSTGSAPTAIAIGDFNRDGKPDLAVANSLGNTASILLGDGAGSFGARHDFAAGPKPVSVATGDFNRDGILDLALADKLGRSVTVLRGIGDGTFGAPTSPTVGRKPVPVAVGDVNGDGVLDLVIANSKSNNVSYLRGRGDGTFDAATNISVGTAPSSIAAGDFNCDGRIDVAVANKSSSSVTVLMGNAAGTFTSAGNFAVGVKPTAVAIGDLNHDGNSDVAVVSKKSRQLALRNGDGNGGSTPASASPYTLPATPLAIVIGDFNGDGKSDFAVIDALGQVKVLQG